MATNRALSRLVPRCRPPRGQALVPKRRLSTPRPSADYVKVIEVGPRDGLQNEKTSISKDLKLELIRRLAGTGLRTIEAGSFVSPKWVPQMASSDDIMRSLLDSPPQSAEPITYQWLLPNARGFETFTSVFQPPTGDAGATLESDKGPSLNTSSDDPNAMPTNPGPATYPSHEISIFLAATESFSKKNTNSSIAESLARSKDLMASARTLSVPVRAYISVALGCPFEGRDVSTAVVADMAATLLEQGADEISVADTTGMGTAGTTRELLRALDKAGIRAGDLALHFHDTFGQALMNTLVGLEHGVRTFDSAAGGLGGCPFSPGATGNLATEDLVYTLHSLGAETGVDLDMVSDVGDWITREIGKPNDSRAGKATVAKLRKNKA